MSDLRTALDRLVAWNEGLCERARDLGKHERPCPVDDARAALAASREERPGLDVALLARAIAATQGDQEAIESLYESGTSWLDVPEEWFMTPRELAAAILAALATDTPEAETG